VVTPEDLVLGAPREEALERAVEGAGTVVLVLTRAFLEDTWARLAELLASHARVMAGDGRLVPLVREPCQLPLRLDFLIDLDCTSEDRWPGAVARLRKHLRRDQWSSPGSVELRCWIPHAAQ
jgi:TIR domain